MSQHEHSHDEKAHHHHALDALTSKNITIVFILTVLFAFLEFIFGVYFNSSAVLSDAVHDTGDAVAIGLAWFFQKVAQRQGDARYSFGYQRFSLLGASITSVILISGSLLVLTQSIPRLFAPEPVKASGMIGLSIFAILANGFAAFLLARGKSRNENILNLHALEDVLGWLAVLLLGIVLHFAPWYWLDPLMSILIAIFILSKAIPKFWGTLKILLESTPEDVDYPKLLAELEDLPEVQAVTQLIIWSVDGEQNAAMIHIIPANQVAFSQAKIAVRALFEKRQVAKSAIELDETVDEHDEHSNYQN